MKKLLALVLALVMTLGLATVGANAAYKDADSINYKEAVDVMSAIGVLAGDETGFRPTDTLKRSEGAKIVAYLMLGNKTAEAIQASGTKYTDLPANHWAAGYMEYLTSAGVMGGVGDGKIDPDGQLTATAFAKMLLTVLGYDAKIEGLVGSDWSINTQKLANDNDLFDGLDILGSAALTREQAAQMCLNDLKADMVEYEDKGTTVNVGGATVVTGAKKAKEVSSNNNNRYDGKYDDVKQLCEDLYGNDLKFTGTTDDLGRPANKWTYKAKDVGTYANSSDLLVSTDSKIKKNAMYDVIGKDAYDNMVDGDDVIYVYVDGGARVFVNDPATYTTDAARETQVKKLFDKDSTANAGDGQAYVTGNGTLYELYREEDYDGSNNDKYTLIVAHTYLVRATADYSKVNGTVKVEYLDGNGGPKPTKFPTEIDNDDFPVADAVKDDYMLVTYSQDTGDFQTVKKATVLEGKVNSFVVGDTLTIDGTKHSYSATIVANTAHGKTVEFDIGSTVKVVLDQNDNVIYVDDADVSSSYLYIKSAGANSIGTKVEAEAYFTDGTSKVITVKKATYYDGTATTGGARTTLDATSTVNGSTNVAMNTQIAKQWYTYSVDDNGEYTLKTIGTSAGYANTDNTQWYGLYSQNTTATAVNVTKKETVNFAYNNGYAAASPAASGAANTTLKANSETVLIVLDDDNDTTVYTGVANVPGIVVPGSATTYVPIAAVASYVLDDSNFVKYGFIDTKDVVGAQVDDSVASDDYAFVLRERTDKNYDGSSSNDYYYEYDLYRNGQVEKNVKVDNSAALVRGALYNKIKTNSKGWITGQNPITNGGDYAVATNVASTTAGKAISYSNGTITLDGTSYVLNTNNIVLLYNKNTDIRQDAGANYEVYTVSGNELKSYLDDYNYTYDYYAVLNENSATKIDELYIFISASAKIANAVTTYGVTGTNVVFSTAANGTFNATAGGAAFAAGSTVYVKANAGYNVASGTIALTETATTGVYSFTMPAANVTDADFTVTGALTNAQLSFTTNNFTVKFTTPVALANADTVDVTIKTAAGAAVVSSTGTLTPTADVTANNVATLDALAFTAADSAVQGQTMQLTISLVKGGLTYTFDGSVFCG